MGGRAPGGDGRELWPALNTVDDCCLRRYNWAAIQAYYDDGHSVRECSIVFGFSMQTWHAARSRGQITTRGAPINARGRVRR